MTVEFTVYGIPQQQGSKQAFIKNGKAFMREANVKQKPWYNGVAYEAVKAMCDRLPMDGPISLRATFYFVRPKSHFRTGKYHEQIKDSAPARHAQKPDLGKLVRCIEDAMSEIVYYDDRQIVFYDIAKEWTLFEPRCEISVSRVDEEILDRLEPARR